MQIRKKTMGSILFFSLCSFILFFFPNSLFLVSPPRIETRRVFFISLLSTFFSSFICIKCKLDLCINLYGAVLFVLYFYITLSCTVYVTERRFTPDSHHQDEMNRREKKEGRCRGKTGPRTHKTHACITNEWKWRTIIKFKSLKSLSKYSIRFNKIFFPFRLSIPLWIPFAYFV